MDLHIIVWIGIILLQVGDWTRIDDSWRALPAGLLYDSMKALLKLTLFHKTPVVKKLAFECPSNTISY